MSLISDRRGRVPFAVLGALLLVSSAIYASTAAPAPVSHPVTEHTIDRAQTEARVALATAVRDASRRASRNPLVEPADEGPGAVLSAERPFRSYLRLLIAVGARDALESANASSGGVNTGVSLPPIENRSGLRRALDAVTLTPVDEGEYRVRFEDLQVTLRRHGRLVERFTYNTSVTLSIPALSLHRRTTAFQERLRAGVPEPGFTRALTARLFAITWARGYAQYGGAPIANVLANRHVEVMANDALLAQQAAVFGRADRQGRRLTRRATSEVAVRDALRGAEEGLKARLESSHARDGGGPDGQPSRSSLQPPLPSAFDESRSVAVGPTADSVFLDFVDGSTDPDLKRAVDEAYRIPVTLRADHAYRGQETFDSGSVPDNASHFFTSRATRTRLLEGSWSERTTGPTLRTFEGTVAVDRVETRFWRWNDSFGTTSTTDRTEYRVTLRIRCGSPDGTHGVPDACGAEGGRRDRIADRAMAELVADAGGSDAVAEAAVHGQAGRRDEVDLDPPPAVKDRAYAAVAGLRRAARNVSVRMETRSVASSANPQTLLADALEERRSRVVDDPGPGASLTDRAVANAEATYLDHLVHRLRSRSPVMDRVQQALAGTLREHAIPMEPPQQTTSRADLAWRVDADPAYLSVAGHGSDPPSMAARNVNVFAVPYGDAADTVSNSVAGLGSERVALGTAARTLRALARREDGDETRERRLRTELGNSLERAAARYRSRLATEIGAGRAERAVRRGFGTFDSDVDRALAIAEGGMAHAIAEHLPRGLDSRTRDRLLVTLREESRAIESDSPIRVAEPVVEQAASAAVRKPTTAATKTASSRAATTAWESATDEAVESLPAGLPLLPVPGYWYATANAWTVSVRGSYEEFVVRAPRGSPGRTANGTVSYVRADRAVAVDVFGDDEPEHLGANRAVDFTADTGVFVVVPPGGTGVGDRDGNADERSPGWGRQATRP